VDRSRNLRVEAYAFIGADDPSASSAAGQSPGYSDSSIPAAAGSNPSGLQPVGLLWNQTISMTTVPWSKNLTLPSFAGTVIPCRAGAAARVVSFPMVQGSAYAMITKGAGGPGSVKLTTAMTSTACPQGAYLTRQAPGIARCAQCPDQALSFAGELATCPGQTCSAVVVGGNYSSAYGATQSLAGGGSIFRMDGAAKPAYGRYTSAANATIAWNASVGRWDMRDREGRLMATRGSLTVGDFEGQEGWYNPSAAGQTGGIQAVVVEQNKQDNLNLCEIEMYDANGTNLLRSGSGGTCYNLPLSTGQVPAAAPLLRGSGFKFAVFTWTVSIGQVPAITSAAVVMSKCFVTLILTMCIGSLRFVPSSPHDATSC
jgi:hypothetical protein